MSRDVAVVVPAHDSAAFLERALTSVLDQTEKPQEIVVVDDGSTDGSHEIAQRLGIQCLRQECRGPGAARNRGIEATSAPLIAFLDADDWFAPEKLEKQVDLLHELDAPACCSDAAVVREGVDHGSKNRNRKVPPALAIDHLLADNPVICSTVLAQREAIRAAGGFDEDPALISTEDFDLWLRLARQGPLAYQDLILAYYRLHASSLSDNLRFMAGIDRIMDKVAEAGPGDPHLELLARRRRAGVRLDAAYDLARTDGRRARELLREARGIDGWTWKAAKIYLRSFLGRNGP